jgi:alkylation response protein AidB-like acyl-CoA dehydrogenase
MSEPDELESFRREVHQWITAADAPEKKDADGWLRRLAARGWTAPTWPRPYGGAGLDSARARVIEEELRSAGVRRPYDPGLMMLGPVLLEFANEEQKLQFLPKIARAEIRWAQGYSEPGAGSDLAGLQMRAEDRGDFFLVNGQKIWTSGAHQADWMFCLVRTDPKAPKHLGISFILLDMKSAGIRVAPITLISGASPFCEVFFDDVQVPKAQLIGAPGSGWTIAKRLLQHERSTLGATGLADLTGKGSRLPLEEVAKDTLGVDADGHVVDGFLRARVAQQLIDDLALKVTSQRAAEEAKAGMDASGTSSILKLVSAETNKARYELLMQLYGSRGLGWEGEQFSERELATPREWLRSKANSIEGGTSEIQLNIIAKRVLGLPD